MKKVNDFIWKKKKEKLVRRNMINIEKVLNA